MACPCAQHTKGHLFFLKVSRGTRVSPYACRIFMQKYFLHVHRAQPFLATAITERPRNPSGVAASLSAHSNIPYITTSMDFSSGKGVVRGRRGQELKFALLADESVACISAAAPCMSAGRHMQDRISATLYTATEQKGPVTSRVQSKLLLFSVALLRTTLGRTGMGPCRCHGLPSTPPRANPDPTIVIIVPPAQVNQSSRTIKTWYLHAHITQRRCCLQTHGHDIATTTPNTRPRHGQDTAKTSPPRPQTHGQDTAKTRPRHRHHDPNARINATSSCCPLRPRTTPFPE